MPSTLEVVLPTVFVLGGLSIPVFWFYFDSRNKASRDKVIGQALEAGAPLEDIKEMLAEGGSAAKNQRRMPFRKGLILMAIGFGLLMSRQLGFFDQGDGQGAGVFGLIAFFLGIALLLSDFFNRKRFSD